MNDSIFSYEGTYSEQDIESILGEWHLFFVWKKCMDGERRWLRRYLIGVYDEEELSDEIFSWNEAGTSWRDLGTHTWFHLTWHTGKVMKTHSVSLLFFLLGIERETLCE